MPASGLDGRVMRKYPRVGDLVEILSEGAPLTAPIIEIELFPSTASIHIRVKGVPEDLNLKAFMRARAPKKVRDDSRRLLWTLPPRAGKESESC